MIYFLRENWGTILVLAAVAAAALLVARKMYRDKKAGKPGCGCGCGGCPSRGSCRKENKP